MINKFVNAFEKVFTKFGFYKNNAVALKLGMSKAVLVRSRKSYLKFAKMPSVYSEQYFLWKKKAGSINLYPTNEPNPHLLITGMSGVGKSALFKSLLIEIRNAGIPCIVFDAQNEHEELVSSLHGRVYDAGLSGINLLALDGASVQERISELTALFKTVYSLGYIQATKLSTCLWYTYRNAGATSKQDKRIERVPNIKNLINELDVFIKNSKSISETNTLMHLRERLSLLNTNAFTKNFVNVNGVSTGLNSFSLAYMISREAQAIYIIEFLQRLYALMHEYKKERGINLYVMIDEAQFLLKNSGPNSSIISKLIEEGRKYGIGLIIVTHAASTLNRQIIANSSTFIAFYSREPNEISYISKILASNDLMKNDTIRTKLSELTKNEAIVTSSLIRQPVVVETPSFKVARNYINANKNVDNSKLDLMIRELTKKPVVKNQLMDSLNNEDATNLVDKLLNDRVLDEFKIATDIGEQTWVMLHNNNHSIEHEVCIRKISEFLKEKGIRHYILDNSKGPDIVAYHKNMKVAIEYETGLKKLKETSWMLNSRKAKFSKVYVVTNEKAKNFYKTYFEDPVCKVLAFSDLASTLEY